MSALLPKDIDHIAKLARLKLTDEQKSTFSSQLSSILDFVEILKEVPTDGILELAQSLDIQNALREDTLTLNMVDIEGLKQTSGLPIIDHQIQTLSAHS